MTLSRCGRQYEFEEALKSAQARGFKSGKRHSVTSCPFGDHWHVTEGSSVTRGLDPFPPVVRAQLVTRDECCQRCGFTGRLEAHHRRAKSSGGSKARSHTQCACNGVMLCRKCHSWVHANPKIARSVGWIVSQSVAFPRSIPIRPWTRAFDDSYPTCEGDGFADD